MWYGFVGDDLAMWSFRKAQKVLNVTRDPRGHVDGRRRRRLLRATRRRARRNAEIVDDPAYVKELGWSLQERYMGITRAPDTGGGIERSSTTRRRKRVALRIKPDHVASWDHRKLGGTY